MDKQVLFKETQRFRQPWLWAILLGVDALTILVCVHQIVTDTYSTINPSTIIALVLVILVTVIIAIIRLDTIINQEGIYIRFFPFHLNYKYYPWHTIAQSFVRQYNPIAEYGGWGIRLGLSGKGPVYNVSGDKGIQLQFTDSSKLLIGTNKPGEAEAALEKAGHLV